ncbi:MAG: efflux RND transporter periplasmic adaptor subunit [Acidobacteria bacterium]|nr:efflux RND transporter periplasmic adaptor subunit [Acidobacteriota bacterium]
MENRFLASEAEKERMAQVVLSFPDREKQLNARLEQTQAELQMVETRLDDAYIAAPISGMVTAKKVEIGTLAHPGTPLLQMEDSSHYRIEVPFDEGLASYLSEGMPIQVEIPALGSTMLEGVVEEISPTVDPATRTGLAKVRLPSHGSLRSGMYGRAMIRGASVPTLVVPSEVLMARGQLLGVYVLDADSRVRFRLVTAGRKLEAQTEVLSGLRAGEEVVYLKPEISEGTPVIRSKVGE